MPEFKKSTRKNKKYMVKYKGKWIHFGDLRYSHYQDNTGLGLYRHLNHGDLDRRANYLTRATGIKNKKGKLTYHDKSSANYYSVRYLWL